MALRCRLLRPMINAAVPVVVDRGRGAAGMTPLGGQRSGNCICGVIDWMQRPAHAFD